MPWMNLDKEPELPEETIISKEIRKQREAVILQNRELRIAANRVRTSDEVDEFTRNVINDAYLRGEHIAIDMTNMTPAQLENIRQSIEERQGDLEA